MKFLANTVKDRMVPGNTFTIEPIFTMHNSKEYYQWEDGWTVFSPNNPSGKAHHIILSLLVYNIITQQQKNSTMGAHYPYYRNWT